MKILLIENNPLNARHISNILIAGAYRVTTASTSLAALEIIKNESFDIIMTKWFMPDIDGLEITRQLRLEHNNTPVIMLIPPADVKMATAFAKSMGVTECISNKSGVKTIFECTRKCINDRISKGS